MLKHLSLEEMVALLLPLVRPTKRRKTFLSIKEVALWHEDVVEAYEAVRAVRAVDPSRSAALLKIEKKGAAVDNRHDHLGRALSFGLMAERAQCLSAEVPDTERADLCQKVHDQLLPDGLAILNTSWLSESGNTARVEKQMEDEPEIGTLLKSIPLRDKKTLLDTAKAWIAVGRELEDLDNERDAEIAKQKAPPTKTSIQAARSKWFRIVGLLLDNLALSKAPPEDIEAIRGPIVRASERAGKRYPTGELDTNVLEPGDAEDVVEEAPAEQKPAAKKPVG